MTMVALTKEKNAPPTKELGQLLYDKNIALNNKIRRSVQAKRPADPNAWKQMRDNFEAIILTDPSFSEQHNIEDALWKLHYKKIEEFRASIRCVTPSKEAPSLKENGPKPPTQITKVLPQLKAFLSEASGFYHDLIMKLRAEYGLPASYFSKDPLNHSATENAENKYAQMKRGLVSCHRCMICLGDLARYNELYGDEESVTRDYAVASSYYLQALSLWPSSGHPHHQLAVVASYSGDELASVYWYLRSLAVESPISSTRETLILLFEKNRQNYLQLPVNFTSSNVKGSKIKVRGKFEAQKPFTVKSKADASSFRRTGSDKHELFRSFCIRFIRMNGIIFTRLSLETFPEVLSLVSSSLRMLLSYGPEEKLNFGKDVDENGLFIVRLVAILIFLVHNTSSTINDQSDMQRKVFLQNACTAIFQLMGIVVRRCTEVRDTCSNYLLPGIRTFLEWLASSPDLASGDDADEGEANVRAVFWNHCAKLLNKLLLTGIVSANDADMAVFSGMSVFEVSETEKRLALWEDVELRGYSPLLPAQGIIDYSRNLIGADKSEDRKARVERVLAACKVLTAVVKVNGKELCFSPEVKKFINGTKSIPLEMKSCLDSINTEINVPSESTQSQNSSAYEEEDEVIVFKGRAQTGHVSGLSTSEDRSLHPPGALLTNAPLLVQPMQPDASSWLAEEHDSLMEGMIDLGFLEDGPFTVSQKRGDVSTCPLPSPHMLIQKSSSKVGSNQLVYSDEVNDSAMTTSPESLNKSPVCRPNRHLGPPPGFNVHSTQHMDEPFFSGDQTQKKEILYPDHMVGLNRYHQPQPAIHQDGRQNGWNDQNHHGQFLHQNPNLGPFVTMPEFYRRQSGLNSWNPY